MIQPYFYFYSFPIFFSIVQRRRPNNRISSPELWNIPPLHTNYVHSNYSSISLELLKRKKFRKFSRIELDSPYGLTLNHRATAVSENGRTPSVPPIHSASHL